MQQWASLRLDSRSQHCCTHTHGTTCWLSCVVVQTSFETQSVDAEVERYPLVSTPETLDEVLGLVQSKDLSLAYSLTRCRWSVFSSRRRRTSIDLDPNDIEEIKLLRRKCMISFDREPSLHRLTLLTRRIGNNKQDNSCLF